MTWWMYSLVANATIITTEIINRGAVGGWQTVIPVTAPLILIAQYSLFRTFNEASHFLWAWAFFTVGNSLMRITAVKVFGIGDIVSWPHVLLGVTVIIGGAFLMKEGLS